MKREPEESILLACGWLAIAILLFVYLTLVVL